LPACLQSAPGAEVWFGFELVTLEHDDDGVRTVLRDHRSGRTREVKTLFVVGTDGAHSTVRAQLGIRMAGPGALAEYHSVQFRAPLTQIAADRRYGLTVITHPGAASVLARRGPDDRWHYAREWRPGQARLADCPQEQLAELIATAASVPGLQPRIERVSVFSLHHEHRQPGRQQLLHDRAVPALDRHPGHARRAQPPDHRPDRGEVMSEAEPDAHRTISVQQAGNVNVRCPVDPRNNALRHSPPHLIDPEIRRRQALVLVAHCKALEARGPIASHSAGPPGPAALLSALEGRASVAVTRRLPATHQHPHGHRHHR
jgi:hypothetical protein